MTHGTRHKQKWWGSAGLSVGLITLLTLGIPGRTTAQTEPDNDTDAYDQVTCQGVEEDEMEDTRDGTVPSPFGSIDLPGSSSRDGGTDQEGSGPFPGGGFQLPFELGFGSGGGQTFSFEPTTSEEEQSRANGSFYQEPEVSITLNSATLIEGEELSAQVNYDTFASLEGAGADFYTVAFMDGVFLNGYMAGGDAEALEQQRNTAADAGRPDCGVYSRQITTTDADADGMDDAWEIRHGLDPSNPADAGEDPDQDGYTADAHLNLNGEAVSPAPLIEGATLGDGTFTNYEEFVMGTDPNNADSDGDGFADEADAVGLGQILIEAPATKAFGSPAYRLHVIVAGLTGKRNEDQERLVKIDSATRDIQAGTREDLEVELSLVQGAAPGETLIVSAKPRGSQQHNLLNTYRWSVNGALIPDSSGQGRHTFEYLVDPGTPVGEQLSISLDVINFKSHQLAKGALTVIIGDVVLLDYDPNQVEPNGQVLVRALLTSSESADAFLFNWSLDGQPVPAASRIGATEYTVPVSKRAGATHDVSVAVYRVTDSASIGSVAGSLDVLQPSVTLTLTPDRPTTSDQPVAEATTDHFGSVTLAYTYTLDGERLNESHSLVTLPTLTSGPHRLRVSVRDIGASSDSASADLDFFVSAASPVASAARSSNNLAAGLSAAAPAIGAGSAIVLGVLVLSLVRLNRSNETAT
ncbi:MAG: hypothetical protein Q8P33_00555 [bacterium]|nr:hypothetical protein [bacterium]